MEGVGWIGTVVIGGLAGWTADKVKPARMGLIADVLSGVAGAVILNFVLTRATGTTYGGWIGQFVVAVIGAGGLIWLFRAFGGLNRR